MKFIFKNLGPIHEAELELGDLTIIAGRNNTGKTYVAYTLYGFLRRMWSIWSMIPEILEKLNQEPSLPDRNEIAKTVLEEGQAKWSVDREKLISDRNSIILAVAQNFSKEGLASVFSAPYEDFEDASIEVLTENNFLERRRIETSEFSIGYVLTLTYSDGEMCISMGKTDRKILPQFLLLSGPDFLYLYFLFLFPEFPDPFILPAERFSISLFYKELDFAKSRLVEALQEMGKDSERDDLLPFLVLNRMASRYAQPLKDSIDYTREISEIQKERSAIWDLKLFNDIRDMMGGSYTASDDDIRFKSRTRKGGFDIPLHVASSSVRGLSDLYFFLRHKARKNQLLIIDEPESHMDTANQIQFARLLARAVHAGLKVLITTHSDYIVKEINNLLMLGQEFEDKPKVLKKLKYSEHDFLKSDSVRAYVAENNSLTRCTIEKYGIDMPVFDTTIDAINRISSELESRLTYEGEE